MSQAKCWKRRNRVKASKSVKCVLLSRAVATYFLSTSGWSPCEGQVVGISLPLPMPRNRTSHKNHQPPRQQNGPSYYQHNCAHYHATVNLVLLRSKAYMGLIKVHFPFWSLVQCISFIVFSPCANHHLLRHSTGRSGMQSSRAGSTFQVLWWWRWRSSSCPLRWWSATVSIAPRMPEKWEKEAFSKQKEKQGRPCHSGAWSMKAVLFRQHDIKLSKRCRLYTTVRLERDKHCLGEGVRSCGQRSGVWGYVA